MLDVARDLAFRGIQETTRRAQAARTQAVRGVKLVALYGAFVVTLGAVVVLVAVSRVSHHLTVDVD